jgi:hypothetical protein
MLRLAKVNKLLCKNLLVILELILMLCLKFLMRMQIQ